MMTVESTEVSMCSCNSQVGLLTLVRGKKYRRLLLRGFILTIFISIVSLVTGVFIFNYQHNNILTDYMSNRDDVVILSATYFKQSKSYPNNTIVLLINAHQLFHWKQENIVVESKNDITSVQTTLRIDQVVGQLPFYCKWVPFLATGQAVHNLKSLSIRREDKSVEIPIRSPYSDKHDVVACVTPLFLNERWQLMLLSAEIYSHYGAWMHFYIRSMLSELHQLLSKYPNTRITPWPAVKIGSERANSRSFDPNLELEFRNQAAAMTDCLLMYKESAKYILFPDMDDIIIPRHGETFLEEFDQVFTLFPMAATVAYNMSQATLTSVLAPDQYSPVDILRSIRYKGEARWGKMVARPELVDSVWIHESYGIRESYTQKALPIELNSISHLRFWNFEEKRNISKRIPEYDPLLRKSGKVLIKEEDLTKIEEKFQRRMKQNSDLFQNLSRKPIYYPIIEKCYQDMFYNGEHHSKCKGPELCEIPRIPGLRCMNANSEFQSINVENQLFFHVMTGSKLSESHDGCNI